MQAIKCLLPFVLTLLMLMHQSQSTPATDGDVYIKEFNDLLLNISKNMNREKLANFTLAIALSSLGDVPKQFIWENIEEILQDPAIVDIKTDKMEEYKLNLSEIVQDYKSSESKIIPLHEFTDYLDSIGLHVMKRAVYGEEDLLVNELIKRIIRPVDTEKNENYNKLLDLLVKAAEIYLNKLSEEERKREEKMENCLQAFQNEKNAKRKAELVATYLGFFME